MIFSVIFLGKTGISNLKLLTSSDFLKFLVEKKSLKSNSILQLAQIDGSEVKISFFNNRTRKKKKKRYVRADRKDNNKSTTKF